MTMVKIKKLSEKTINQIAAGEVVDRPSSVIKELVENAIDAKASSILVEIEAGGKNMIRVSDNGLGMSQSDLELAVERHATSKLNEEDINCINSLGFRGEALPSIGSIANLTITTREKGMEHAWRISVNGGDKSSISPAAGDFGTTIEVKDLFMYTPARLKFMRSDATERANILSLIQDFALCYPSIHFKLSSDGEGALDFLVAQDEATRMSQVFGNEFAGNMVSVNRKGSEINIRGFIGVPTFTHKSGMNQRIFINGRAVKDKQISAAIKAAYANLMTTGYFPAIVLHIEIDPYEVDVNVHPAKTEVRLRDPNRVKSFVISSIRSSLSNMVAQTSSQVVETAVNIARTPAYSYEAREGKAPLSFSDSSFNSYQIPIREQSYNNYNIHREPKPLEAMSAPKMEQKTEHYLLGQAVFQLDNTYIVAESQNGLIVVDQHAAHERLVLEQMKLVGDRVKSQVLLIPQVVELGEVLVSHLIEHTSNIEKYGIVIERNGITQVLVRQIPEFLAQESVSEVLKELAEMIAEEEDSEVLIRKREEVLGNIACRSSIRAGRKLSLSEMNAILRQIESTPHASQCNHGRPTFVTLDARKLAKIFERV
jgi:DNA mismatch repair protein MutL